jgi:hypothetical protein
MTVIDDVELGQRLRALRADPPANGFEALLAMRLLEVEAELKGEPRGEPPARVDAPPMGRVIVGPWLRRHPVRLIGAAALLLAGAAAAVEGGVVEWVQMRVAARAVDAPAPTPPAPDASRHAPRPERRHAASATLETAAASAAAPIEVLPLAQPEAAPPSPVSSAAPPPSAPDGPPATGAPARAAAQADRDGVARAARHSRERGPGPSLGASRAAERRSDAVLPVVPRLAIEPRPLERMERPDRVDPARSRAGDVAGREAGRDLERIRDIARARRERTGAERPRVLERLRERRERNAAEGERGEGRGSPSERGRREHPGR